MIQRIALTTAFCTVLCVFQLTVVVVAFYPSSVIVGLGTRQYAVAGGSWRLFAGSSFWKQKPGESDKDFFKRISQAASTAEAFENASFGKLDEKKKEQTSSTEEGEEKEKHTKKGYQRAEDWEAEQKAKKANGELTWEERVQFEGLQKGNRFKQNEILRQNIKWGR